MLLLSLALVAGCGNVCDRMCTAQADVLERCFPTWESSWEDQSYASRQDFTDRCQELWGQTLEQLEENSDERERFADQCQLELETALSDTDCESLLSIDP